MNANPLPLRTTHSPAEQSAVVEIITAAHAAGTPVYPIGGGTSLDFGLPAKETGDGLSLTSLNRVIDYPARDMTITVEAGVTLGELSRVLSAERQQLPFDAPHCEQATLGGLVAANFNGPRKFSHGGIRDFVIGITAVDGRGMMFHGGGRVVKNVAGYDFCKLLTGSFGTLGVITQLTMKVRPLPTAAAILAAEIPDEESAERVLAALVHTAATPAAIELVGGPAWAERAESTAFPGLSSPRALLLAAKLEGSAVEVEWMLRQLESEWKTLGCRTIATLAEADAATFWPQIIEFPGLPDSPLTLKADVTPSGVTAVIAAARDVDPQVSFVAHAGHGCILLRFPKFPEKGLAAALMGRLQPTAAAYDGRVVVLANRGGVEATRQGTWGSVGPALELMTNVKRQFDPKNILNRGRFVYLGL